MKNRPSRSWAAPTGDQCRSPVARVTGQSFMAFAAAVVSDVCTKFPEQGGSIEGAVNDALTNHLHLLQLTDPPKEP